MTAKPVIGFIGLGFMGHGMAKNILKGGYSLHVKGNRNRTPVESLVNMGAVEAATPAAMAAKCDIIHLCLSNSPQVEETVLGADGILAGARPGLIVIDTTTADPNSTLRLAKALAEKGCHMVDAPLGRTPKEAEAGTLDAMVGCDANLFDRILPVLNCWAGTVNRVGDVGAGHKMKLLMNFLGMTYAALYSEAITLGAKVGIAPQTFQKVIGPSRLGCGFFETFTKYAVGRDRDAHKFSIANASKDLRYVNAMATEAGVVNIMASAARHYFTQAEATGHGEDYVPMLSDLVAALNGVDLAAVVAKGE